MNIREKHRFICEPDYPIVQTEQGKILGFVDGDVFCYRGIEYAYADRFQMPVKPASWEGIREAFDYGPGNPEMTYNLEGKKSYETLMIPQKLWTMSEHVQNLNIWTKSIDRTAKRPVMVWMHGGGFAGGSATQLFSYEGWEMAHNYDVVVVTLNHRLNMLGFLDLSAFGERYENSANLGMADLVAALEWVRDNIEAFGGDPENVTIYGQSGGGGKVSTLLQMPAADGLYHKAIIQSGVMMIKAGPQGVPNVGEKVAEKLGLTQETIQQIETIPYTQLAAAVSAVYDDLGFNTFGNWAPKPDGKYFVGDPRVVGFREETKNIPLIVGSCLAEFDHIPTGRKSRMAAEEKKALIDARFPETGSEIAAAFAEAYPDIDISYASCVDPGVRPSVIDFSSCRVKEGGAPVYNYVFTFESPLRGGMLTGHNGDIHFMFHNALYNEAMVKEGVTERLQDDMAGAWAAFAEYGTPNREGLTEWKAYTPDEPYCILFGDQTVLKEGHDLKLMELLKGVAPTDPIKEHAQQEKADREKG